jgi:putative phage-type endonuclease
MTAAPYLYNAMPQPVPGIDPTVALQILPPGAPRTTWLSVRRTGIGGSDVSTLVGLNKWSSEYELWLDKTGQLPLVDDQSEAAEMGTLLEPVVRDRFARSWGLEVRQVGTLQSQQWPWMLANPDGLCSDGSGYEGKTCSIFNAHEWAHNQTSDHAELQAQWGMATTGLDHWWVAVLIGGQHNEYRLITRDQELIDILVSASRRFWHDHVLPGVEPIADGTPAATRILKDRFPTAGDDAVEIDPQLADELVTEKARAAQAEKDAHQAHEAVKNRARQLVGDRDRLVCGDHELATWRQIDALNLKRLEHDHPDLVADYTRPTEVHQFDLEAFKTDHPTIYAQYRRRALRFLD